MEEFLCRELALLSRGVLVRDEVGTVYEAGTRDDPAEGRTRVQRNEPGASTAPPLPPPGPGVVEVGALEAGPAQPAAEAVSAPWAGLTKELCHALTAGAQVGLTLNRPLVRQLV